MPPANNDVLRTVADELMELVRKKGKVSIEEAARELKSPASSIQALADFLVEEKVFGIEYKFTTPYIYLYSDEIQRLGVFGRGGKKDFMSREEFYKGAREKKIPHEQVEHMWKEYVAANIPKIKEDFFSKAKQRGVAEGKIKELWNKYLSYL